MTSKIAKIIESQTIRIECSVYFYEQVTQKELNILTAEVLKFLDEEADDLHIYTIKDQGIYLGSAIDLNNPFILI